MSSSSSRIPERFAIMAVDPGETTGVARAFLNASRAGSSMSSLMKRAIRKDALRVEQVRPALMPGHPKAASASQASQLYRTWERFQFKANVELAIPYGAIWLVIEDFQLRQRSAELWPVEVTHALLGLLTGRDGTWAGCVRTDCIEFQQPSTAMTYATNDRLKRWGLWTRGMEHGRDATRHLALAASRILDGDLYDRVRD